MITVSDFFAGAGGSSTGMTQVPGVEVRIAANHWQTACDIHNANHPNTDHAMVDLHQERPSYFPRTDVGWFSPECTKWSQANGSQMPAIEEGLFEDPLSDDVKLRSRLLMFDVLKFVEYHRYRLVVVENVVDIATQAKYRTAWTVWRQELRALGYRWRVVSLNSMHAQLFGAPAPQSRDRIYIVAWPEGEPVPDLDRVVRPRAHCARCDVVGESVQSFKRGREVGRYRQAYEYCCPRCGSIVTPGWLPASMAIDWSIRGQRIGDRDKPLADKTLARVAAGIARYWGPLVVEGAGNTYDASDPRHPRYGQLDAYYRAWPAGDPLGALQTTNTKALAVPVEARDGLSARPADVPMRTQTSRLETALAHLPFVTEMYGTSTARPVTEPAGTFTAGGNHHALVRSSYRDALIHRHKGAEVLVGWGRHLGTTLTTGGNVSLLQRPGHGRVTAADLAAAREMLPDVEFRMFEPTEVAAGMAFPADYLWQAPTRKKAVSKRDIVKLAGNAVTPPSSRDVVGVAIESIGAAA